MAAGKRFENETLKTYHNRLKDEAKEQKARSKGRLIWDSAGGSTYVRSKYGRTWSLPQ